MPNAHNRLKNLTLHNNKIKDKVSHYEIVDTKQMQILRQKSDRILTKTSKATPS